MEASREKISEAKLREKKIHQKGKFTEETTEENDFMGGSSR